MKTFLLSMAGAFVAIFLFILLSFFILAGIIGAATATAPQPDRMVLTLDLRETWPDQAPTSGFAAFAGEVGFTDLLVRIDRATNDDSVSGIFIRGAEGSIGSSRAEELRSVLTDFRASGKFVIAHTQGSMLSTGPSSLRAISASDEIWMQPGTDIAVTGISFETEFLAGMFDYLSITPEILAFHEYKNAPNSYTEEGYTEAHRRAMIELADSLWVASLEDIAADRGTPLDVLRSTLESGPLSAEQALEAGIVDQLGWPIDARDRAEELAGNDDVAFVDLSSYVAPVVPVGAPMIAVVGGEGPILTGSGGGDPFGGAVGFASDNISSAILEAGEDENIKAIVFRVDSPGGSPTASDQIWRAVERVQANGTPVIVSMGTVAASGGYYVSAGADHIVANDTTITGSIGIFGGKFAIGEGLERIGVNIESVSVGGEWTEAFSVERFSDGQRTQMREILQRGYDRFTLLVAEGRDLTLEEVDDRARGRVWSGRDALERGLVDSRGGFLDAVDRAREAAGIDADQDVRLIYYPARRSGFEALEDAFGVSVEAAESAAILNAIANDPAIRSALEELSAARSGHVQARGPRLSER